MGDDIVAIKLQVDGASQAINELRSVSKATAEVKSSANAPALVNPLKTGSLFSTAKGSVTTATEDWYQAEMLEREKAVFARAADARNGLERLSETVKQVNSRYTESLPLLGELSRTLFGFRGAQLGRALDGLLGNASQGGEETNWRGWGELAPRAPSMTAELTRGIGVLAVALVGFKALSEEIKDLRTSWSEMIMHLKKNNPELAGHVKAVGDWFSDVGDAVWQGMKDSAFMPFGFARRAMESYNMSQRGASGAEKPNRRSDWENIYNRRFGNNWSG